MSKELTPLEALERLRPKTTYEPYYTRSEKRHYCDIIETTLKKYDELTNKSITLYSRTHGRTQALIDLIGKNYKEVKITNLEDEKKLKALKIIKEKKVDVFGLICCIQLNEYTALETYNMKENCHNCFLTQEEFDLLKEVLL